MAKTLVKAGLLIDGTGAAPAERMAILVDGDRIAAVGRQADIGTPDGARIVEANDRTVMPGLIDAHVHLAYSGIPTTAAFRNEHAEMSYPLIALRAARYAQDTLLAGFTSVRDMHAPGGTIIDLRDAIEAGHVIGPRIRACGLGLTVTGGHMDQPGWGDHAEFRNMTLPCDGPIGFRQGVRAQLKRGADFIKLNTCVSTRRDPNILYRPEMEVDEIEAAVREAHAQGVKVGAHTVGGTALLASVRAGVDTLEHAQFADDETLDLVAEKGSYITPTLLVNERNFEFTPEEQGISPAGWHWLNKARAAKWDMMTRAIARGCKILSGSDTGFMLCHGERNAEELVLLEKSGLSRMQVILAATATAAEAIEIDAGQVVKGRFADMLLVDGNPLDDLTLLTDRSRLRVLKGGEDMTAKLQ